MGRPAASVEKQSEDAQLGLARLQLLTAQQREIDEQRLRTVVQLREMGVPVPLIAAACGVKSDAVWKMLARRSRRRS